MEKFFGENKEENIYLDNGASTLALLEVKEEADEFLKSYGSVHRGSGYNSQKSTKAYENSRDKILDYIDGDKNEDAVIFTSNTTDGINKFVLMSNYKKVLISDIEHSSNRLPWEKSCEVVELKTKNFQVDLNELEEKLKNDRQIELVALTAASNITGLVTDVKEVYKICKKYGVVFFLDASQYAPHFRPSLKNCDVMVYCGHKMYAPFGSGVLAGKKELFRTDRQAVTGGGNVIYVGKQGIVYKDVPYMHESGTPNGLGCVTLAKAHEILYTKIGEKKLEEHTNKLVDAIDDICDNLESAGYRVYFGRKVKGVKRTPTLIISNTKMSNKETVRLLNETIGNYNKNIFCREGAFCAYRLIEKLGIVSSNPIVDKNNSKIEITSLKNLGGNRYIGRDGDRLSPEYSLIRFSAGLINNVEDIRYLEQKLIAINKMVDDNEYTIKVRR